MGTAVGSTRGLAVPRPVTRTLKGRFLQIDLMELFICHASITAVLQPNKVTELMYNWTGRAAHWLAKNNNSKNLERSYAFSAQLDTTATVIHVEVLTSQCSHRERIKPGTASTTGTYRKRKQNKRTQFVQQEVMRLKPTNQEPFPVVPPRQVTLADVLITPCFCTRKPLAQLYL